MAANEEENHLPPWLSEDYEAEIPAVDEQNQPFSSKGNQQRGLSEDTPLIIHESRGKSSIGSSITHRGCCHMMFTIVSLFSLSSSVCLLTSQALPFLFTTPDVLQVALRCYVAIFTVVFILSELEVACFTQSILPALDNWAYRGLLQSFIGLIGIEESVTLNYVEDETDYDVVYQKSAAVFITASSYMMIVSGVIYFLMGVFCLRGIRDRCRKNYSERLQDANKIEMDV